VQSNHIDQLGRPLSLPTPPQRIISCVPSTTELLFDLGLDQEVIGITKFCVRPDEWHQSKTRVGGTKNLHLDTITELNPDLIICDKEENTQEQVEELMQHHNVWISDTNTLEQGLDLIGRLGQVTGKAAHAEELKECIEAEFKALAESLEGRVSQRAVYLIWKEPIMVAGAGTFIHDMMEQCGLENPFPRGATGYPEISVEMLQESNPDLLLLSSEPFPFAEKHLPQFQTLLPKAKVMLVDGEMFSWPGSRMEKAAGYFKELTKSW